MNLVYNINDRPKFPQMLLFALQQLLAILAATIAVPAIIGNGMSQSAALFGAGVGTIIYQLFTKFKSPVFLGSSFAFISSMFVAFSGAIAVSTGYLGLVIGATLAGLVYVAIGLFVSSLTENQLSAAVGTMAIIIGFLLVGVVGSLIPSSYAIRYVFDFISIFTRFQAFTAGYLDIAALFYYISVAFVFLYLTVRIYDRRRYS